MNNLPFTEIKKGYSKIRIFDETIDEIELKWHRDQEDRKITILESKGWKFQMDNCLPVELNQGDEIFIKKETYHRVIKGLGELKIKVEFL
jgi:hypothetical protein